MLKTTTVGNYPKLPSEKGQVNIRKTLHKFDKGEISRDELEKARDEVVARVIREHMQAGIDLPTDGQTRWDDIVTPFASKMEGFQIGGLLRWFDNNVYYRKPQAVTKVKWVNPITAAEYKYSLSISNRPLKPVLPAPFSFVMLCDDHHYHDYSKFLMDITDALKREAAALVEAGAKHIQFDDPCLPYFPQHAGEAIAALNEVADTIPVETWTCFYFSSLDKIARDLGRLKTKVIAADCVSHPANFDVLLSLDKKFNCGFGIVDARNIKMEDKSSLMKQMEKIAAKLPDAYISPSCGLEFLPHREARTKLDLLTNAVSAFNGGRKNA